MLLDSLWSAYHSSLSSTPLLRYFDDWICLEIEYVCQACVVGSLVYEVIERKGWREAGARPNIEVFLFCPNMNPP